MRILGRIFVGALAFLAVSAQPGAAAILLENKTNIDGAAPSLVSTGGIGGLLSRIDVGGSAVDIDGFGMFGQQAATGTQIKFALFDSGGSSLFVSGAIAATFTGTPQWYDSPSFAATLLANATYYFGLISNVDFGYWLSASAGAVAANGLTSPAAGGGANGSFSNFASPTVLNLNGVSQVSLRVSGDATSNEAPEPAALALLGLGLAVFGFIRGRKRRD